MTFLTITQTHKATGIPTYRLRAMAKQKQIPGFYSGTRFYVAFEKFLEIMSNEADNSVERSFSHD
jgi:hypothetical protein